MTLKPRGKHPLLVSKGHKPRTGTVEICPFCEREFYLSPSRGKMYKQSFCCKGHMIAWMKQNAAFVICVICGEKKFTQPFAIKYKKRSTCSRECYSVLTRKRTIERHSKLPIRSANRLARRMPELTKWRKAVFERDNFTCQECGKHGGYLEADHIKPFAYFPELRHVLSNGRTLCRPCHDKTKVNWRIMRKLYAKEI